MSTRKRIWRLEYHSGHGVFSEGGVLRVHYDPPGPDTDPGLAPFWRSMTVAERGRWHFGFVSLAQYKRWFRRRRQHYTNLGLRLVQYEVPAKYVHASSWQAIFLRVHARQVDERAPHEV